MKQSYDNINLFIITDSSSFMSLITIWNLKSSYTSTKQKFKLHAARYLHMLQN